MLVTRRSAEWLSRAYDDMKAMGGVGLSNFNVSPGVNDEPLDWTWPITNDRRTRAFADVLARSDRSRELRQAPRESGTSARRW